MYNPQLLPILQATGALEERARASGGARTRRPIYEPPAGLCKHGRAVADFLSLARFSAVFRAAAGGPADPAPAHRRLRSDRAMVRVTAGRRHGLQSAHRPRQGGLLLPIRQPRRNLLRQLSGGSHQQVDAPYGFSWRLRGCCSRKIQ